MQDKGNPPTLGIGPELFFQENKYFTPSIEDIRVGYEFEVSYLHEDNWVSSKVRHGEETRDLILALYDYNRKIRVSYLTKEQIEKEGWRFMQPWMSKYSFHKGENLLEYDYKTYNLRIMNKHIPEESGIFDGECKDINTFRYICKLLGI